MSNRVVLAVASEPMFLTGIVIFVMVVGQVTSAAAVGVPMIRNSVREKLTDGSASPRIVSVNVRVAVVAVVGVVNENVTGVVVPCGMFTV